MLQANPMNYKSLFNLAMKIHNSLILAGGAGQIPEPNAINDKSWLVLSINIHNPSSPARGAAQNPQAHVIDDNSWPLIKCAAMKTHNSSISARGAGQFPEPNTINDKSWLVPTINIHYPSNHTGGAAQIPQAHAMIVISRPLIEGTGQYSAFDLSLDKHHALMELEKLARRLLIDHIDGFNDNKEATHT